jgi:hypothetical protein
MRARFRGCIGSKHEMIDRAARTLKHVSGLAEGLPVAVAATGSISPEQLFWSVWRSQAARARQP